MKFILSIIYFITSTFMPLQKKDIKEHTNLHYSVIIVDEENSPNVLQK